MGSTGGARVAVFTATPNNKISLLAGGGTDIKHRVGVRVRKGAESSLLVICDREPDRWRSVALPGTNSNLT